MDSAMPPPPCGTIVLFILGPAVVRCESRGLRTATPTSQCCGSPTQACTVEDVRAAVMNGRCPTCRALWSQQIFVPPGLHSGGA